jgi:hypothetical protein
VVGLGDIRLADIIKDVIKNIASEIGGKEEPAQALSDIVKRLVSGFHHVQISVTLHHDGRVAIWITAETM